MLKVFKTLEAARTFAAKNADLLCKLEDIPFWEDGVLDKIESHICLLGESTKANVDALMAAMPLERCAREIPDVYRPTPWFTCFILFADEDEKAKNVDPEDLDPTAISLAAFFDSKQACDYYGVAVDDSLADARAQAKWKAAHPDTSRSLKDCNDDENAVIIGVDDQQ